MRYVLLIVCLCVLGCLRHDVAGSQQHEHNVQGTQQHQHQVHHDDQRIDVHIWKHKRRERPPR